MKMKSIPLVGVACLGLTFASLAEIDPVAQRSDRLLAQIQQAQLMVTSRLNELESYGDSPFMCQGRLTLQTGTPVPTIDLANRTTLYFTPYLGSRIALYNGSIWVIVPYNEISLNLTGLTANTNYDVFIYNNSGIATMELTAWASDTARATTLVRQDGILVRSGASTRRYVGTIRTTSTTQTQDTSTQRFVWNFYHRQRRPVALSVATNSWNYNTAAFRAVDNDANNVIEYVSGLDETTVHLRAMLLTTGTATNATDVATSFGWKSTTVSFTQTPRGGSARNTIRQQMWVESTDLDHGEGYINLYWLEYGNTNGATFYGDAGDTRVQSGLTGWIHG